jgi:putative flavoprotein involved in K+ transport
LPFLRRRKSTFIHGCEDDVHDLAQHLHGYLSASGVKFHSLRAAS